MKAYYNLTLALFLINLISCGQMKMNLDKDSYKLIEDYKELKGYQYLTRDSSIYFPFTKEGYSVFLPNKKVVGSIVLPCVMYDSTSWNDIYNVIEPAIKNDLAVIMISNGKPIEFLFKDDDTKQIDDLLNKALISCKIDDKPLFFVGISLGGTVVMKHAEYCLKGKSEYNHKPKGLILVDSPLDFIRWWHGGKNDIRKNYNSAAVYEAKWTLDYLEKNLGGTPETGYDNYIEYSPYVYSDTIKKKLTLFEKMPILAISEPDIQWWMKERGKDYYDLNTVDLAALINDLKVRGNKKAELVITTEKGYRENGMRHPHSWSIVDNGEIVKWCINNLKKE